MRLVALRSALALSQEAMAQVLGASTRSVVRWEKGEVEPGRLVMERLDQLEDLRKRATRLFGSGAAGKWFRAPNQVLSGLTPLDRMRSPGGVQEVRDLLGRIEWGIPS